jgi:hypothetical protein
VSASAARSVSSTSLLSWRAASGFFKRGQMFVGSPGFQELGLVLEPLVGGSLSTPMDMMAISRSLAGIASFPRMVPNIAFQPCAKARL